MFEKLSIQPKFAHAGDFKTAPNMFTENKYTPEHRQQVEGILLSVYSQLLQVTLDIMDVGQPNLGNIKISIYLRRSRE
jgi:hypothetical protein